MSCKLSVNVNAIAYLRNRRNLPWPSLEGLGRIALEAGAAGLTIHPRPDERHIRHADVPVLRELIWKEFPDREYNIEGFPDERFLRLVEANPPDQVTLVPDDPAQGTSDHGWDVAKHNALLKDVIARLHSGKMRVSVFVDADPVLAEQAKSVEPTASRFTPGLMAAPLMLPCANANLARSLSREKSRNLPVSGSTPAMT